MATAIAAAALLLLLPAAAQAGIGASIAPSLPPAVTVGQTGIPAALDIRNVNSDADLGATNTVCNFGDGFPCPAGDPGITMIPSCGQLGPFSSCAAAEPGVFRLSDTGVGQAGSTCAGMPFTISLVNPANGQVRFTPQGGAHITLPGVASTCRIAFTFSVLRAPTADQNPTAPGIQTIQVADNTQYSGALTASARGTNFGVTVNKVVPTLATVASPPVVLGGQISDTASVAGRYNPSGGTIDFRLYGPDDADCSQPPVFESLGVPLRRRRARGRGCRR